MFNNIRNRFPYAEINVVPSPGGYGYQVYKDKLNEVGCLGEITLQKTATPSLRSRKTIRGVLNIIHAKIPTIDDNLLAEDTSMET